MTNTETGEQEYPVDPVIYLAIIFSDMVDTYMALNEGELTQDQALQRLYENMSCIGDAHDFYSTGVMPNASNIRH